MLSVDASKALQKLELEVVDVSYQPRNYRALKSQSAWSSEERVTAKQTLSRKKNFPESFDRLLEHASNLQSLSAIANGLSQNLFTSLSSFGMRKKKPSQRDSDSVFAVRNAHHTYPCPWIK